MNYLLLLKKLLDKNVQIYAKIVILRNRKSPLALFMAKF